MSASQKKYFNVQLMTEFVKLLAIYVQQQIISNEQHSTKFHVVFKSKYTIFVKSSIKKNSWFKIKAEIWMKIESMLSTSSLHIHFLWNLFFLCLFPAPRAAFSATMLWYFFLLLLVREGEKICESLLYLRLKDKHYLTYVNYYFFWWFQINIGF